METQFQERGPETPVYKGAPKGNRGFVTLIIVIIIVAVIITLVWVLIYYVTRKDTSVNPPPLPPSPPLAIVDTTGESTDGNVEIGVENGTSFIDAVSCNKEPTRKWTYTSDSANPVCVCINPFYGPDCTLESFLDDYFAVGTFEDDDLNKSVISSGEVNRLSFPHTNTDFNTDNQTVCSDICNNYSDCIGFIYDQSSPPQFGIGNDDMSRCTVIRDAYVVPGGEVEYDPTVQSRLFLRKGERLKFKDKVFLYSGTLPIRYWASDRNFTTSGSSWAIKDKILYQLDFIPTAVMNDTGTNEEEPWVGVMSFKPIPISELKEIIEGGTTDEYVVIPSGSREIDIPQDWVNPYAIFVSPSDEYGTRVNEDPKQQDKYERFYWNKGFSDESGMTIKVSPCETIVFVSDDGLRHDMWETNERWFPIEQIKPASRKFQVALTFKKTTYLRCNHHPNNMRLKVEVESNNELIVDWNLKKCGNNISNHEITLGTSILFSSNDYNYHGLSTRNSPETISAPISKPFRYKITPTKKGKYKFVCRVYGDKICAYINVI